MQCWNYILLSSSGLGIAAVGFQNPPKDQNNHRSDGNLDTAGVSISLIADTGYIPTQANLELVASYIEEEVSAVINALRESMECNELRNIMIGKSQAGWFVTYVPPMVLKNDHEIKRQLIV